MLDYSEARASLLELLVKHRRALALPGEPLGVTDKVKHRIILKPNANPSYVPSYRLPHSHRAVVRKMIEGMLDDGVIRESYSQWNSPLFLVPKKDGTYCPVVDFFAVNKLTVPDHYPLPVLSQLLQANGKGNTVFTILDLKTGFWQIPLDAKSREVTACSTSTGHYEWLRCPMGLRNTPLATQRWVNSIFSGIIGDGLFTYLDDFIVVSKDLPRHLRKLALVFDELANAGLKLNPSKCSFLKSRIEFLNHVVDKDGIYTNDAKIHAVKNFPTL